MIYLLLGEDSLAKDQKIAEIKDKWSKSPDASQFDYEVLHATKLNPAVLKKSILALPAIAHKRLIVIRSIEDLSGHNQEMILGAIESKTFQTILILDSNENNPKDSFINKIVSSSQVIRFQESVKQNVFDMTRAMSAHNPIESLKILSGLLTEGVHPLQIMGGLVWFWGKSKARLPKDNFKKGLLMLQEADLNIKRSRLRPDYVLEVLVTKLSYLIA